MDHTSKIFEYYPGPDLSIPGPESNFRGMSVYDTYHRHKSGTKCVQGRLHIQLLLPAAIQSHIPLLSLLEVDTICF